ncbi:MAG: nucleotide exchange factor GrpE [Candidatus Thiodiazotropha lotti]|uniref:nucleotide exchange factor GrpE n=1 Tax=Candidatus Thiodiazotropha endoloripes TaxID=1818881 RepID=UPI00083D4174|nr:nucleotide exchange factor GrpE [Candidatus Thiodiazotropha endoloripes]MCG7900369.1 nucleotide exchange factor GrpE [Candidatus Thiodiazotropha weberae]MCG7990072.1 nucleotide exchange factor GrpE [Candidatus Thiodiazotropha lotti]MCG8000597.1 nucleotide exchange factor GrpE [Candidatus Thiodiazotropha lotti]MCW4181725.1 nucleotide exchange factor GrpE [Candidatus Thiodiazotropha weberae]MCW4192368.1 nucleotide exchange factor GrpE [Candidatus Thiodiazotropha weberae]
MIDKDQPQDSAENVEEPQAQVEEPVAENEVIEEAAASDQDHQELTKLLEDARSKADEHWDQVMRMRAEMDNLRKRGQRDLENAHKFALDKISQDMLQVWDSLELGYQASLDDSADIDKIREGTELTLKLLVDVMNRHGIEQVDPEGEAFNPEFHQAMSMQERDDVEPNTVVAVVQKGYLLNGRLLRPAMVMVSKASSGASIDEQA